MISNERINTAIERAFGGNPAFDEDYSGKNFAADLPLVLDLARWVVGYRVEVVWGFRDGRWEVRVGDGSCSGDDIARCVCFALLEHAGEKA